MSEREWENLSAADRSVVMIVERLLHTRDVLPDDTAEWHQANYLLALNCTALLDIISEFAQGAHV